jgi:hypothetical protein
MTPRKQKHLEQAPSPEPLRVTNPHAAGIDVHSEQHWAVATTCHAPVSLADNPTSLPPHVRVFDFLCYRSHKVPHVVEFIM